MSSPTARSLAELRKRGYIADVVERWIPGGRVRIRKDLFGIADIMAVFDSERHMLASDKPLVVLVQATSDGHDNVESRIRKIAESAHIGVLRTAGISILVHGWSKRGRYWRLREVDCS